MRIACKNTRIKKVANDVFNDRREEMMLVRGMENAHASDGTAFFAAVGTNADAVAQAKESKPVAKVPLAAAKIKGAKPAAAAGKKRPAETKDLKQQKTPEKLKPLPPGDI